MEQPFPQELIEANAAFEAKSEAALRALFKAARARNEVQFALGLIAELRGMQDAGWNTAAETQRAFGEYFDFIEGMEPSTMKCRIALSFYVHLAEASGFYEVPKNMMRIASGEGHSTMPFSEITEVHKQTGQRVAPNANKVHRNLAGHAADLGMVDMAEVFRDAFDPDIRNGYAHADYVIWRDGLRLPKRATGRYRIVPWDEFDALMTRAINFFQALWAIRDAHIRSYNPPKRVVGRLNENGESTTWTIYSDPVAGRFGIRSGGPS